MATFTIDEVTLVRTAQNWHNDDLILGQIKDGGSDNLKYFKMTKLEQIKAFYGGDIIDALISQNAPIPSQTSGTFNVGMIVSTTTYVAGDDFSNWTLVSGTVNTTGAVYQVTAPAPTAWSNGSTLAYDGRPYIVSTDENGNLNPFINTVLDTITFGYSTATKYYVRCVGRFLSAKTTYHIERNGINLADDIIIYSEHDDDNLTIKTSASGILYYTPIRIIIKF